MRFRLRLVSFLPTLITAVVLGLSHEAGIAADAADHDQAMTNPSVETTEAGCDAGSQEDRGNEKVTDSKQAAKEGDGKKPAKNENLFLMFLQVLRSAR